MLKFQNILYENKHRALCHGRALNGVPYIGVPDLLSSSQVSLLETQELLSY